MSFAVVSHVIIKALNKERFMQLVSKFIKVLIIVAIAFLVLVAGLLSITVVLNWSTWEIIGDWLTRTAIITGIIVALSVVIALLTSTFRKS